MSLTTYEHEVLLECANGGTKRWGAAVGAALESLRGAGYLTRASEVTPKGLEALAEAKLIVRPPSGFNTRSAFVVEIWGGPGAGKSTIGMTTTVLLKLARKADGSRVLAEYTGEEAKGVTWDLHYVHGQEPPPDARSRELSRQQAALFARQHRRVTRLLSTNDFVVSDSPLWLNAFYADRALYPDAAWREIIAAHYEGLRVLHVWVERELEYERAGRNESEADARTADEALEALFMEVVPRENALRVAGNEAAAPLVLAELRRRGLLPPQQPGDLQRYGRAFGVDVDAPSQRPRRGRLGAKLARAIVPGDRFSYTGSFGTYEALAVDYDADGDVLILARNLGWDVERDPIWIRLKRTTPVTWVR